MQVGDIVRVKGNWQVRNPDWNDAWPECYGQVGVIVELLHAASNITPIFSLNWLIKITVHFVLEIVPVNLRNACDIKRA